MNTRPRFMMTQRKRRPGRYNLRYRSLIFLLLGLVGWRCTGDRTQQLPNIVIIFADDLGYSDVGTFGAEGFATPNLDAMAAAGVRLTDFYVSSPVCSASRAALLTGSYHRRVGISGALNPHSPIGIARNEMTLAELLKQAGYATAAVGKWHLGHHPEFLPVHHGFDRYFGIPYSNDMSPDPKNNPRERARKWPPLPLIRNETVIETEPDQSRLIERYTAEALSFIREHHGRPFFLYYAHTMPHVPLYASASYLGTSAQGLYGDVVQEIDASVGAIMGELERQGLIDNTLVIFTSDNGPWKVFGNHGGSCRPLRGSKGTVWEGGIRVPFIARWPGRIPAGALVDTPAMTIDMLPTIAYLTGTKLPEHPIDGVNIWQLLAGTPIDAEPHDVLFFYYQRQLQAMRAGRWKLHFPHTYRQVDRAGADGMPGTYIYPTTGLELYDLHADVAESVDVADEHPDVVRRLSAMAERMRKKLGDELSAYDGVEVRPPDTVTVRIDPDQSPR